MEDRDSALAIIQKFNGYQLQGANLPLQVRFADSLAQKKLKGQTARKRMWRTTREFAASLGGVSIFFFYVLSHKILKLEFDGCKLFKIFLSYRAENNATSTRYS